MIHFDILASWGFETILDDEVLRLLDKLCCLTALIRLFSACWTLAGDSLFEQLWPTRN